MAKKKTPFQENKNEIKYNIINSAIAGGLVFVGSFADGTITLTGVCAAIAAALLAALVKFKSYWSSQENEYTHKLINFV